MQTSPHASSSTQAPGAPVNYSLIIPVYNEEGNVEPLHRGSCRLWSKWRAATRSSLWTMAAGMPAFAELAGLAERDARVRVVRLRRNFGQTPAIAAGIDHSRGQTIVFMDADLQNDPNDIPRLLSMLEEGYDVVSGWRQRRHDTYLTRVLPSKLANGLISFITGVHLHDFGCSLKAYRREVLAHVNLYGEMHRFIPAYAAWAGASIAEVVVEHHPRVRGTSKYGLSRAFRVVLDLVTAKFLSSYATKPIYVFGGVGLFLESLAFLCIFIALIQKFTADVSLIQTPLTMLSAILGATGFIAILQGLNAEVTMRTYHESQQKPTYAVRQVLNPAPSQNGAHPSESPTAGSQVGEHPAT